ncbi:MAG: hypothetical protein M3Z30_08240 [Gemmatimonadota bacterium]|nr:hypothetical protein [Gemmatimonadota bacterium]
MAHVSAYSQVTTGTVPRAVWDESWFSIASWKGYLQSIPGCLGIHLAARRLESGDARIHVTTLWQHDEQRQAWVESDWAAERLLRSLDRPAYDIITEAYDVFC